MLLLMVVLDSGSSSLCTSPARGHCVVFLGNTLYSHIASLGTNELLGQADKNAGGLPVMDLLAYHSGE